MSKRFCAVCGFNTVTEAQIIENKQTCCEGCLKKLNLYQKEKRCVVCEEVTIKTHKIEEANLRHHYSYFPELIVLVHESCHNDIHDINNKFNLKHLVPPTKDYNKFKNSEAYKRFAHKKKPLKGIENKKLGDYE